MDSKYESWILLHVPQTMNAQLAQCTKYVPQMQTAFPELVIKKGVVSSPHNPDNFDNYRVEYPHMWLETAEGEIIDPTVKQFSLLGRLDYEPFPDDGTEMHKCIQCGSYFSNGTMPDGSSHSKDYPFCSKKCLEKYERSDNFDNLYSSIDEHCCAEE